MAVAAAVGGSLALAGPAVQAAAVPAGYEVVFQNSAGHLAMVKNGTPLDLGFGMAPSTNPAVTSLADGSSAIAYQRLGGYLTKYYTADGSSHLGNELVAPGTGPGIVLDATNHTHTVFQSNNGVRLETDDANSTALGGNVATVTSPSNAVNLTNGLAVTGVWAGSDGYLWQFAGAGAGHIGVGLPIASGTSPSAAAGLTTSAVAYNGGGGDLTIYTTSDASVNDTGEAITAGTSPSMAALADGAFVTAFVSGGTLRVRNPDGVSHNTGLGVAPNSSPAIAADSHGGWEIAFTNTNKRVATYSSTGQTVNMTAAVAAMKAGTSPVITALPALPGDNLPLTSAVVMATHNSFSGNQDSGTRGAITYQLEHGVRFLELDIYEDGYATNHDYQLGHDRPGDKVDHTGGNPASNLLRDWLQQIAGWSALHPDHAPLIVMLDLKNDLSNNASFAAGDISALNAELRSVFGSALARPEDYPNGLPTVGALRGRVIGLLSGDTNSRAAYLDDNGQNPAVAINNHGQVVEVHSSASGGLWFWTGMLGSDGRITWQRHEKYDSGVTPAVTMNDSGTIVEVHRVQSSQGSLLYYHVGQLDLQGHISWGPSRQYDTGVLPTIRFTGPAGSGLHEIHRAPSGSQNWQWNATVNTSTSTITWSSSSNIRTSDPLYDTTTSGTGFSQVHVWSGVNGTSPAQTLLYSTSAIPVDRIRYEQVAYVDTQPGDSADLDHGALVHSAIADDTAYIKASRLAGHITRSYQLNNTSQATTPFPNVPATDFPWASWYTTLLNQPTVHPYVVQ
jgi:hypothetical protein